MTTANRDLADHPNGLESGLSDALGGVREFTIRAGVVDGHRQLVGQHLGQLVNRDVIFRGQLPHRVIAQNLSQLIRRDRQVVTVPDP